MQTAVSWLEQEFIKLESTIGVHGKMYELIEQAKEMEKQQIINAINDVSENNVKYANKILSSLSGIQGELFMHNDKLAKQYYNEIYGSKGSDEIK